MNPKLSIVTINYNNDIGLQQTIESVVNQNFSNFEYIIIDGGSTDNSKSIIEKYSSKISYWVSEKDSGIYNAMNKGISIAKGEYILFLNSGDSLINSTIIDKVFKQHYTEDILYGDLQTSNGGLYYPAKLSFFYFFRYSLGHPASFIKKALFEKLGNYNEENKIVSDWEFFLKAIIRNKVSYLYLEKIISYYDIIGISTSQANQQLLNKEMVNVLQPYLEEYYGEVIFECNKLRDEIYELKKRELKRTWKYKFSKIIGKKITRI